MENDSTSTSTTVVITVDATLSPASAKQPNNDRPLVVDENSYDQLTIARMTDHNVSGHEGSTASQREQDDRFSSFRRK